MKKLFKYSGYAILGFIVFVLVYLGLAWLLERITIDKETGQPEEMAIYIRTNGVHTDLVLPIKSPQIDWSREISFANTHLKDTVAMRYLSMGWGDKGFYLETPTWADLKISIAFKAAFGLGATAMHATFYEDVPDNKSCRKIMISVVQYARLVEYISNSFQKDAAGHVIPIVTSANYGQADAFYEATRRYSLFNTCNTWANNSLKSCGQKACLWTPFDTGIFLKYP